LVEGRSKRQKIAEVTTDEADVVKRRFFYDYERARACIQQDYLGEHPTFGPDDFKRMFRVSHATYDSIWSYLSGVQSFFRDGKQVTNQMKISADGKVKEQIIMEGRCPTNCAFDPTGNLGLVITEAEKGQILSVNSMYRGIILS
jgi:hypothetical protein